MELNNEKTTVINKLLTLSILEPVLAQILMGREIKSTYGVHKTNSLCINVIA